MRIFIKDTEILEIFVLYLCNIDVLIMTSYCKSFVGFPLIITEKLKFYRNKHNDLKREMMSKREIGGAGGIHITLCSNNKSLLKVKKSI